MDIAQFEKDIKELIEKRVRFQRMKDEYYRYLACLRRIDNAIAHMRHRNGELQVRQPEGQASGRGEHVRKREEG